MGNDDVVGNSDDLPQQQQQQSSNNASPSQESPMSPSFNSHDEEEEVQYVSPFARISSTYTAEQAHVNNFYIYMLYNILRLIGPRVWNVLEIQ